jgi:hypothetical protein
MAQTPIPVAISRMQRLVKTLNKQSKAYRAEGLPFSFVSDPCDPDLGLLVPVGRYDLPENNTA